MNTTQLKKNHSEAYREFFNKYDLVVSCPIYDDLVGHLSRLSNAGKILSWRLPLRNYIGVMVNGAPTPIKLSHFESDQKRSVTSPIEKFYRIGQYELEKLGVPGSVGFLSEYNWNDPFCIAGLILAAKHMLNSASLSIEENSKLITAIFKLASQHWPDIEGLVAPKRNPNEILHPISGSETFTLNSSGDKPFLTLPAFRKMNLSIHIIKPKGHHDQGTKRDLQKQIFKAQKHALEIGLPYQNELAEGAEMIGWHYAVEVISGLTALCDADGGSGEFYNTLASYYGCLQGIMMASDFRSEACLKIESVLRRSHDRGNCFVCASGGRYKIFSDRNIHISRADLANIAKILPGGFTIDYSSHEDGWETEGIKLEQWRSKGVYSEFTSPYAVTVAVNGLRTESPAEYEEALARHADGVVLDLEEKRIFVCGKPVTSKELKSQAATIDLLERLTKANRSEISNKDLPASAYSKDRSEMSSKILSPLRKIVEKRLGKDFPVETRGSSDGGFTIRLGKCDVTIAAVRKR